MDKITHGISTVYIYGSAGRDTSNLPTTECKEDVSVPFNIEKEGSRIRQLEEDDGARIQIRKEDNQGKVRFGNESACTELCCLVEVENFIATRSISGEEQNHCGSFSQSNSWSREHSTDQKRNWADEPVQWEQPQDSTWDDSSQSNQCSLNSIWNVDLSSRKNWMLQTDPSPNCSWDTNWSPQLAAQVDSWRSHPPPLLPDTSRSSMGPPPQASNEPASNRYMFPPPLWTNSDELGSPPRQPPPVSQHHLSARDGINRGWDTAYHTYLAEEPVQVDVNRRTQKTEPIVQPHLTQYLFPSTVDWQAAYGESEKWDHVSPEVAINPEQNRSLKRLMKEKDTFNIALTRFPEEMWFKVFSYLSVKELRRSIPPVCRTWQRLAEDPSLYINMEITDKDDIETEAVTKLINGKQFLKRLTVWNRGDSPVIISAAASSCPNLEKISIINGGKIPLKSLADGCRFITELCFSWCDFTGCSLSNLENLTKVRCITLDHCTVDDAEEVTQLTNALPVLEELTIRYLSSERPAPVSFHEFIPWKTDSLRNLEVIGTRWEGERFQQVFSTLKRLLILDLGDIILTELYTLPEIFQLNKLVWLRINSPFASPWEWERALENHCLRNVRHLHLEDCPYIGDCEMKIIGETFPHLSYLFLSHSVDVSDEGVTLLMEYCNRNLRFLIMRGLLITGSCFSSIHPGLTLLDVSFCWNLDCSHVPALLQRMPQLALCWWDNNEVRTNDRFDELKDAKELQRCISVKEVKEMYGITE